MTSCKFRFLTAAAVILTVFARPAVMADSIILTLTGIVTNADPSVSGTFNTSQTFSATLTIELDTPGQLYGSATSGYSEYPDAITNFEITVGSYTERRYVNEKIS